MSLKASMCYGQYNADLRYFVIVLFSFFHCNMAFAMVEWQLFQLITECMKEYV